MLREIAVSLLTNRIPVPMEPNDHNEHFPQVGGDRLNHMF